MPKISAAAVKLIKKFLGNVRYQLICWLAPSPVNEYGERTMMYLTQQDASQPNKYLLDLAQNVITRARDISLADVSVRRKPGAKDYPDVWPGEHYRLLAALMDVLQPLTVVEVGTYHGLSALSLYKFLPSGGTLTTFDIVPWKQFQDTCLTPDDFSDGRLVQEICDLSDREVFRSYRTLFEKAELIFLDGPKDRIFERKFLEHLSLLENASRKLLVLDDIRTWKMLAIWRRIMWPKLDFTSFGHWTGTGFVDWNGSSLPTTQ